METFDPYRYSLLASVYCPLRSTLRFVLIAAALQASSSGKLDAESLSELPELLGVCRQTVYRALTQAASAGWAVVLRKTNQRGSKIELVVFKAPPNLELPPTLARLARSAPNAHQHRSGV